jgi:hypothetical protein
LIYEIRVYEAAEGKADAMRRRFLDIVATKFFPRHGIELIGSFTSQTEDGRLTYMTRFADEDARKKAWAAFGADADWAAGQGCQRDRWSAAEEPGGLRPVADICQPAVELSDDHEAGAVRIRQAAVAR